MRENLEIAVFGSTAEARSGASIGRSRFSRSSASVRINSVGSCPAANNKCLRLAAL